MREGQSILTMPLAATSQRNFFLRIFGAKCNKIVRLYTYGVDYCGSNLLILKGILGLKAPL